MNRTGGPHASVSEQSVDDTNNAQIGQTHGAELDFHKKLYMGFVAWGIEWFVVGTLQPSTTCIYMQGG